jgi:5-methylcytosine-specific restriction endonuclease McrA
MKPIKKEIRVQVWNKYGNKCAYCGVDITYKEMQADHIHAVFRGYSSEELEHYKRKKGTNKIENLNPSCGSCNSSKSTFTLEQWRTEIEKKQFRIRRDSSSFRILERFKLVELKNIAVVFYFERFK